MTISSVQVFDELTEWLLANAWVTKIDIEGADGVVDESAARRALMTLSTGDVCRFREQPVSVQALALRMLFGFMVTLRTSWEHERWPLLPAWQIVAREVACEASPPSALH